VNAGGLELLRDGETLLFGFHGAGTGDHGDVRAADFHFTGGGGDGEDGIFFFHIAGNEFVGLGDGNAVDDARHGFENAEVDGARVAGNPNGGAPRAGNGMGFEAEGFDFVANGANLCVGGVGLHDDEHVESVREKGRIGHEGTERAELTVASGENCR